MTALIRVEQAVNLLRANRLPAAEERISIEDALGRRLAAPIIAQVSRPPAAMSAMDGYAVRLDDVRSEGARLKVIGEAPAGRPFNAPVRTGTAVRIFTGSVVPNGADHIVIQENATRDGDDVISMQAYDAPRHIRAAGLDFVEDDILVESGTVLEPAHLAVAAASNNAAVKVERRQRVGMLSNGDELRPPGTTLAAGEIINSNPYGLAGLIGSWGGEAVYLGTAADSVQSIQAHIDAADVDIFVPIGGASVGDHDHMHAAFTEKGFAPIFQKVAVRPGKPTWFSKTDNTLALGLPGNPASAMVCAMLFLAPLLGADWRSNMVSARLRGSVGSNGPREHFMRAHLYLSDDGVLEVDPAPNQDSSLIRTFLRSNALIRRLPSDQALNIDDTVQVLPISPVL